MKVVPISFDKNSLAVSCFLHYNESVERMLY